VLCAHLERGLHVDNVQADEPQTTGSHVPS
jgi:hypothetical protein